MQKLRLFGMNGVLALILACSAGIARGQQAGYLILIDAENKQPFTARIGETLMQSSAHGHLLISQLKDSTYLIAIRFPHNPVPDQVFPVSIHKKDQGLQLRKGEDSWVLYNWQSKEAIRPLKEVDSSRLLERGIKREDGFSNLMAAVVNDTSVMYNTFSWNSVPNDSVGRKPGRDSLSGLPGRLPDGAGMAKNRKEKPADTARQKSAGSVIPAISKVRKLREVSLKISRKMVFQDISPGGEKDTITLFVYFEKPGPAATNRHEDPMVTARRLLRKGAAAKKGEEQSPLAAAEKEPVKSPGGDSAGKKTQIPGTDTASVAGRGKSGCLLEATDTDAEALRSAILVRNTEDEKISVAAGAFAMKCFSVAQVRQLTGLFVSDKAKYRFLHAAHGHISDADHFQELAGLLLNKAYVKRFMALVHQRQ
jgi:hypothetical protein